MKLCNTFQSIDKVAKTSSSRNNVFSNFVPSYYSLLQLIQSVAVYWSGTRLSAAICSKYAAAAAAKSLQSRPTLCDPIDSSPSGSPVPGIIQTRTLEWSAISFSNAWKWKVKVKSLIRVRLPATPWTAAHRAPQPMGFARQEYWSGVPLPSPRWYTDL